MDLKGFAVIGLERRLVGEKSLSMAIIKRICS
jgi:hypothetical protein